MATRNISLSDDMEERMVAEAERLHMSFSGFINLLAQMYFRQLPAGQFPIRLTAQSKDGGGWSSAE